MRGSALSFVAMLGLFGCGVTIPPDPECLRAAPRDIHLRDSQQSFNSKYYSWVCKRSIYIKPNRLTTGKDEQWQRLRLPPELADDVQAVVMDDRFLEAVNSRREIWLMAKALEELETFDWLRHLGMPFGIGDPNFLEKGYRKWSFSSASHEVDRNYTDSSGWRRQVGWATCSHMFLLKKNGMWIGFNDGWLPADWNYEMCTPKRGRFISQNLSSSGARHMVINKYGDIFTRIFDYDVSGGNEPFEDYFDYTYQDQRHITDDAERMFQLPSWPWYQQPKIRGRITDRISLHKIRKHGLHALMRVEGWDSDGRTGYYEKDMHDVVKAPYQPEPWRFVITDDPIKGTELENLNYDSSEETLGSAEDVCFQRNLNARTQLPGRVSGNIHMNDWAAEVLYFHPYCSPAVLRIHVSSFRYYDLVLHTTETLRTEALAGRGLLKKERPKSGTIEVPLNLYRQHHRGELHPVMEIFIDNYLEGERFKKVDVFVSKKQIRLHKVDWFLWGIDWTFKVQACTSGTAQENGGNVNDPQLNGGDSYGFVFEDLYLHPHAAKIYTFPGSEQMNLSQRNIYRFSDLQSMGW